MAPVDTRLCLNTPHSFAPEAFAERLAAALEAGPIASVRLRLRDVSAAEMRGAITILKPLCHAHQAALLITGIDALVAETGLDGVHFEPGPNAQIEARKRLGRGAIIGVGCGASRHHGLIAGERGADYVSFGPIAVDAAAQGEPAPRELFEWWQAMIELPVLAEGGATPELAKGLAGVADFVAAGRAVWSDPDGPASAVRRFLDALSTG